MGRKKMYEKKEVIQAERKSWKQKPEKESLHIQKPEQWWYFVF